MPFVIQLVWNNKQFESYLRTASLQRAEEAAQISAGAPPPLQQRRSLKAAAVITVACNYHVQRMKLAFKKSQRGILLSSREVD